MDVFFDLPWRVWPAAAISGGGTLIFLRGIGRERLAFRTPAMDMAKPLGIALGLRLLLLGGSLLALGLAWTFQVVWLFWFALMFAGEETWETSMVVFGLRQDAKFKSAHARRRAPHGSVR